MEVDIRVAVRVLHLATAGAEHEAIVHGAVALAGSLEVVCCVLHATVSQCHLHRAHLSAADDDGALACTISIGIGLTAEAAGVGRVSVGKDT